MGKRRIPLKSAEPIDSLLARTVEEECDLHGLDAHGAELKLEMFLDRSARTRPGAVVRVITGRGNRSAGGAVLLPLVAKLLAGPLARHVGRWTADSGGGAYLVEIRGV